MAVESAMYWLDVDGDRTGIDVLVNGVSAEHLRGTHGIRFPINEYLLGGQNWVEVRRGLWGSTKADGEGGEIGLTLTRKTFHGIAETGSETLIEQRFSFEQAGPRMILARAGFTHAGQGTLSLHDLDPIGGREQAMILDALAGLAAMWRDGNGDALVAAMTPYLTDYARAYPLENLTALEERVRRMAASFTEGEARFDRNQTRLIPLGDGRLVDCLSPAGAAVRVARPKGPDYDMWTVMGIRDGRVQLVR